MDDPIHKRFSTLEEAISDDRKILQQMQSQYLSLNQSMDKLMQMMSQHDNASSKEKEALQPPPAPITKPKSSIFGSIFSANSNPVATTASVGSKVNSGNLFFGFDKPPFITINKRFEPDFGVIINNKSQGNFSISSMGTQLHFAAANGNIPRINDLIFAGAPVDFKDWDGNTALVVASRAGHWNVVVYLLHTGARPDINEGKANAPLRIAMQAGQVEVVRLVLRNAKGGWSDEELTESLSLAKSSHVMSVVKDTFPSNVWDRVGSAALQHCARLGFEVAITALLDSGVNINAVNSRNVTALQRACGCGHVTCARVLIERGAQFNTSDNDGDTPLHEAAQRQQDECIRVLLEAGADKYVKNFQGKTPFEIAHTMTAKILLR